MKEYRARNYKRGHYDINPYFDHVLDKFSNDTAICEYSEEEKIFIQEESQICKDPNYFTAPTRQNGRIIEQFLRNQQKRFFLEYKKLSDSEKSAFYNSSTKQHGREIFEFLNGLSKNYWRLGHYQNIELITLKHAVHKFLQEHNSDLKDFVKEIAQQSVSVNILKSLQFLFTFLPFRLLKSIYSTLIAHFHPQRFTPLTDEQKTQILAIQRLYGKNWIVISNEMQQLSSRILHFIANEDEKTRQNRISLVKEKSDPEDIEESQILQEYREDGSFIQIARKYKVKVTFVRNHIIGAFSRVTLLEWNDKCNFITAIHVLKYNFYCTNSKALDFIELVENLVQNYQIISIPQGNVQSEQKVFEKEPEKLSIASPQMYKQEILNENENKTFEQNSVQESKRRKSNQSTVIENKEDGQFSGSNGFLNFLIDENQKVLTSIDDFFLSDLDTNIKIDCDSIFWRSIMNSLPNHIQITNLETKLVVSKFKQLSNSNNLTTFKDLIDWIKKYAYLNILERVREIISQQISVQKYSKKDGQIEQ